MKALFLVLSTIAIALISPALFWTCALLWLLYQAYLAYYFRSNDFLMIEKALRDHVADCNALNEHIGELKATAIIAQAPNYGSAALSDTSLFKLRRPEWSKTVNTRWVHNCSATVAKNAHNQPFKYLCKYFDIPVNEQTLEMIERALNNFAAAEQGKNLLLQERKDILDSVRSSTPAIIARLSKKRLARELGFQSVDLNSVAAPVYSFQYVSAAGKSSFNCDIKLGTHNLELFAEYLGNLIKFKNSVAGQRALMTASLRERIKARDNYTCQHCGLSTSDEKNLLLEIDHRIPLSKGGITSEANLQTLCWRCNRKKGAKLMS